MVTPLFGNKGAINLIIIDAVISVLSAVATAMYLEAVFKHIQFNRLLSLERTDIYYPAFGNY